MPDVFTITPENHRKMMDRIKANSDKRQGRLDMGDTIGQAVGEIRDRLKALEKAGEITVDRIINVLDIADRLVALEAAVKAAVKAIEERIAALEQAAAGAGERINGIAERLRQLGCMEGRLSSLTQTVEGIQQQLKTKGD